MADYNEKAKRDREKSAAMPFIASNLGGGTLAGKVAHQIDENRAASERSDTEDAVAPYAQPEGNGGYENNHMTANDAGTFDDDGPFWPSESAESAFLSQRSQLATMEAPSSKSAGDDEETSGSDNLPALDSLVSRIPEETRNMLESLFRAKFVTVRKIPKKLLK